MNGELSDTKLINVFATSMMAVIGSFSLLYISQRLFAQQAQPVQPEGYGIWYLGPAGHIMNVENGPDEREDYIGEAAPGTPEDYPGWRIYKYDYVIDPVSGDMLSGTIRYAGGSAKFDKVWDDRASYEYS